MPDRPYEVERDRFGVHYSGPLEVGECIQVVPVAEVERLRETLRVVLSFGTTLPRDCREIVWEALNG